MFSDYIIKSNSIFTSTSDKLLNGFIAVKGNKIVDVNTVDKMEKWVGKNTKIISYKDKLVMPGFCDSHVHLILGALEMISVNVSGSKSEEDKN